MMTWEYYASLPSLSRERSLTAFSPYSQGNAAPNNLLVWSYPSQNLLLTGCCLVLCAASPVAASIQLNTSLAPSPQHSSRAQLACFAAGTNTAEDRQNIKDNRNSSVPSYSLCHSPGGGRQWNERATHPKQCQGPAAWQLFRESFFFLLKPWELVTLRAGIGPISWHERLKILHLMGANH